MIAQQPLCAAQNGRRTWRNKQGIGGNIAGARAVVGHGAAIMPVRTIG